MADKSCDTPALRTKALAVLVALAATPLAGCLGPGTGTAEAGSHGTDPSCGPVKIPAVHAGTSFTYDAEGFFGLQGSGTDLVYEYRWEDEDDSVLPEGSQVRVAVGSKRHHVGALGHYQEAFQATYWVEHPDHPEPLAVADQYLSADDGQLVFDWVRYSGNLGGQEGDLQLGLPQMWNDTGLLQAPLLWDRPLREGDAWRIEGAEFPFTIANTTPASVELTIEAVDRVAGACEARAELIERRPYAGGLDGPERVEIVFRSDRALPVRYTVHHPSGAVASLELAEVRPGSGERLPAFQGSPMPETNLSQAPPFESIPAGGEDVFPTSFRRAVQAVRDDPRKGLWLDLHPDARPVYVYHGMGHPEGSIIDAWLIEWRTPDGDRMGADIEYHEEREMGDDDRYTVDDFKYLSERASYPEGAADWVTMEALALVHHRVYGTPPEVLVCQPGLGACHVGTHDGTNQPQECDGCDEQGGGLFRNPGITVDLERGWVLREQSFDRDALAAPAS